MSTLKKLFRSRCERRIAGVAGGIGEYFEIDPVIARIVFVILLFVNGIGLLLYIFLIFVIPLDPEIPEFDAGKFK